MITATGHVIELAHDRVSARIGTVAGVLRALTVDGNDLVEPTADGVAPTSGNGIVLSPWPNRVADARWTDGDVERRLAITEPALSNALHGLLRFTDYRVTEQTPTSVTLSALIAPQTGWPYFLDTWVRYDLADAGLIVTHGVVNLSADEVPYATGSHPFFRLGDAATEDLMLTLAADTYFDVDERLNPIAELAVDGTDYDLREGRRVGDLVLDTAFGGITLGSDRTVVARLADASGRGLEVWHGPDFGYSQVYTTPTFAAADGSQRTAVAVEPMTAPPDALNSGLGLILLEPGGDWEGSWGIDATE